jgi:hypothetical protein
LGFGCASVIYARGLLFWLHTQIEKSVKYGLAFISLFIGLVYFSSCKRDEPSPWPEPVITTIKLVWYQSYESENKADVEKGLLWTLSFLGANLEDETAYGWNGDTLTVDAEKLGLADEGLEPMLSLFNIMRNSEEYEANGAFDMGRFAALTLLSSNHYYKITGVPKTLEEWMAQVPSNKNLYAITESTVSIVDRLISMNDSSNKSFGDHFIAYEGFLDTADQSFELKEYEVFDIMPNGQMRFAIYGLDGKLKTAADEVYSLGGKPSKCVWCHETNINPNFANAQDVDGFKTVDQFNNEVADWQSWLDTYKQTLNPSFEMLEKQDHTFAELLYIGFMQPNATRLAAEWNMTKSEVENKLNSIETHNHEEFSFMNGLYFRHLIEAFGPFEVISVPFDAREASINEPNLL